MNTSYPETPGPEFVESLSVVAIVFSFLTPLIVILRFLGRHFGGLRLDYDDAVLVPAVVSFAVEF